MALNGRGSGRRGFGFPLCVTILIIIDNNTCKCWNQSVQDYQTTNPLGSDEQEWGG